jgi:hypothetical protein
LTVLRAYLAYFAGQRATNVDVLVDLGRPAAERRQVSVVLLELLGLTGLSAGDSFRTPAGVPDLSGTVEHISPGYGLLRAVEPTTGLYAISCFPMAEDAPLSVNLMARLYRTSTDTAEREHSRWTSWLENARQAIR